MEKANTAVIFRLMLGCAIAPCRGNLASDAIAITITGTICVLMCYTVSGTGWYVKIGGEETSETGGSHAHQVSKGDPGE